MSKKLRMVITGGGTGGHFFPAMAIKSALEARGIETQYIGSEFGVENNHFSSDENALLLTIRGIQRSFSLKSILINLAFPYRFLKSYFQCRSLMKKFQPRVVIGTGGYSSGLPLLAAMHIGIKTVIQEQNSYPGITTRHLANKVDRLCIAHQNALEHLKKKMLFLQEIPCGRIFN